jgi:hypothetical protein
MQMNIIASKCSLKMNLNENKKTKHSFVIVPMFFFVFFLMLIVVEGRMKINYKDKPNGLAQLVEYSKLHARGFVVNWLPLLSVSLNVPVSEASYSAVQEQWFRSSQHGSYARTGTASEFEYAF